MKRIKQKFHPIFHGPSWLYLLSGIKPGIKLLRDEGHRAFLSRLKWHIKQVIETNLSLNDHYKQYLFQHRLTPDRMKQIRYECEQFDYQPIISIITPVYNVDPKWLDRCVQSVIDQLYSNWELCLHDDASSNQDTITCLKHWQNKDPRIKISYSHENQHISTASNKALEMASGEFIGLLDNDDELTPDALYEMVKALNTDQDTDMLYSDEDKLDSRQNRIDPHFKPDWSPETFESMMYSCHFGVYRCSLIEEIGGFRVGFEGSQDYDLVLRVTEKTTRIRHIPQILYHWRMIPGSAAATIDAKGYAYEAAEKALQDRLNRENNKGQVQKGQWTGSYRVRRQVEDEPLVSIIIPFKDKPEYLRRCLTSIRKSSYDNTEILLVSNNSEEKETFSTAEEFQQQDARISFHEYNQPFNYSAINNWGANLAKGEYLLFLNNDTEVISPGWIEAMLEQAARKPIGAVGAKLLYSNKTVQHSGVILGIAGVANHAFRHLPAGQHGYFGYANVIRNYSSVTAACLMIQARKFWEVGGFDEKNLAVSYNDVDLCLELLRKGYRNVYTPYAQLYHFESVSRENDKLAPEGLRFSQEKKLMQGKWGKLINNDPYYNPNLTLEREDFSLRV